MDITIKTLRLATIASAEIPIPGLSTALETVLSIAKKIKVSLYGQYLYIVQALIYLLAFTGS